jgi:hypothetical protein
MEKTGCKQRHMRKRKADDIASAADTGQRDETKDNRENEASN